MSLETILIVALILVLLSMVIPEARRVSGIIGIVLLVILVLVLLRII